MFGIAWVARLIRRNLHKRWVRLLCFILLLNLACLIIYVAFWFYYIQRLGPYP